MQNRQVLKYRKQTLRILGLATDIQNKGIGTAFFHVDAHVAKIDVQVHLVSWTSGSGPDARFEAYIGDDSNPDDIDRVIIDLQEFITHHSAA